MATLAYYSLSGIAPAYLPTNCQLSSEEAAFCQFEDLCHWWTTATMETDVLRLPAQSCGTAFQLVLGKWTLATNSLSGGLNIFCIGIEIAVHCD